MYVKRAISPTRLDVTSVCHVAYILDSSKSPNYSSSNRDEDNIQLE